MAKKTEPNYASDATKDARSLDQLNDAQQLLLVDQYVQQLERYLRGEVDQGMMMQELSQECSKRGLILSADSRPFSRLLRLAYSKGYIRITPHLLEDMAHRLRTRFPRLTTVRVVAGSNPGLFARSAAIEFLQALYRLAEQKRARGSNGRVTVNVGVVSGRTTGEVIRAVTDAIDWDRDLEFPFRATEADFRFLAVNVCLAGPEHLSGHATVLVNSLAARFNRYFEGRRAYAFGLSAPLVVKATELVATSAQPQTFDVVKYTQPHRVRDALKRRLGEGKDRDLFEELGKDLATLQPQDTLLDLVLTGVGDKPPSGGPVETQAKAGRSIFYSLAEEFGFNKSAFGDRVVGDLAFIPIDGEGKYVPLQKAEGSSDAEEDQEYLFFTAVDLDVLKAMARPNSKKAVMVVARSSEGITFKEKAIFASVRGQNPGYVSHLILDEATGGSLEGM